jgi:hypothetical protein
MKLTLPTLLIAATLLVFPLRNPLEAQILVSNDFTAPGTPSNFNWTGGSFTNATFDQAWNSVSTGQQYFTTSFTPTSLGVGDRLTTTFLYNPNSTNITSVRVGLFSGTPATVNGWNQFNASSPAYGWVGYVGSLATGSGNSAVSMKTNTNTHSFFGATNGSSSVPQFFGFSNTVAASLSVVRNADSIISTLSQGLNLTSLTTVVSFTNTSSAITNFNILSFYTTTPGGNVDMRYDTVRVEFQAIPEPSTYALMLLGGVFVLVFARRMRSRSTSATR